MKKKLLVFFLTIIPFLTFAQENLSIDEQIEKGFKPFSETVSNIVFYPITISHGSPKVIGYETVNIAETMLKTKGDNFKGKTVVISGSGKVAQYATERVIQLGAKVVTLSDSSGYIYDSDGIDTSRLAYIMELINVKHNKINEYITKYPNAKFFKDKKPWEVNCDVALSCAIQSNFGENEAKILVENGVSCVVEGINMSTSSEVTAIFKKAKVPFSNTGGKDVPIVIIILLLGALYFTIYNRFANIRLLGVAINAAKGKYDDIDHHVAETVAGDSTPNDDGDSFETIQKEGVIGEVTHFQALTAALSATVGLGNIAGVAVAIAIGGPGATLWMILAGFIGMSSKLVEATLGVKYREVGEDGKIYGGPMYYLTKGLKENNMAGLGKFLAVFFAIMVVGGSFGGGNMFQANQAAAQFKLLFNITSGNGGFLFGLALATIVGLVIIGGIKRIGKVTERVVPFMAIIYVGAALVIVFMNFSYIPDAFAQIWNGAFNASATVGGFIGVMIVGFQRAAFSNEAGVGSASIAHAAVKTRFPASEGIVASIGPFVDTVIICTMSAMVIVIMNLKNDLFQYGDVISKKVLLNATGERIGGVDLTSVAFDAAIPNFSIILTIAVILFAFSTLLSWSYYGLQGWYYLFGRTKIADYSYKLLFLFFVIVGSSISLGSVIDFSDAMIFAMVFPNIIGLIILAPKVRAEIKRYLKAIGHSG